MADELKTYQREAARAATAWFLQQAGGGQRGILLEAPTGSGKTLIASEIVRQVTAARPMLWFWVAPFKGVVGQAERFLREQVPAVRVRDPLAHRSVRDVRPGDCYVMSWQTVSSRDASKRRVLQASDLTVPLGTIVSWARSQGYGIGVVIDEAHHGFLGAPVAQDFYSATLAPDLTLLVTATPNDEDVNAFSVATGVQFGERCSVSRTDAVEAGLIKRGVRCVTFVPSAGTAPNLVDAERTALRFGLEAHRHLQQQLVTAGHQITPLMLVQVDSTDESVARARATLESFGMPVEAISVHTAAEPDPHLLATAQDEGVQVIIFKMALALGFDAPRAWTLVSMRRASSLHFGVQVVGRVLRVERRLHGVGLPHDLDYGYVFLADPEVQEGLRSAAAAINALTTEVATVTDHALVRAVPLSEDVVCGPVDDHSVDAPRHPVHQTGVKGTAPAGLLSLFGQDGLLSNPTDSDGAGRADEPAAGGGAPVVVTQRSYALNEALAIPRCFLREELTTASADLASAIAAQVEFGELALAALTREGVSVVRRDQDLFRATEEGPAAPTAALGVMNTEELRVAGARVIQEGLDLVTGDYLSLQALLPPLRTRVRDFCLAHGLVRWTGQDEAEVEAVERIFGTHPVLLRRAIRQVLHANVTAREGDPIPREELGDAHLRPAARGAYGVIPGDLNSWERAFVTFLENDTTGTVLWWYRNRPRQPYSVMVVTPELDHNFYPDFVIGVKGRAHRDGILLADPKLMKLGPSDLAKLRAEHCKYGRVMILELDEQENRFWVMQYDADARRPVRSQALTSAVQLVGF